MAWLCQLRPINTRILPLPSVLSSTDRILADEDAKRVSTQINSAAVIHHVKKMFEIRGIILPIELWVSSSPRIITCRRYEAWHVSSTRGPDLAVVRASTSYHKRL